MFDLIIKNGTIIDGTGSPAYKADLAICGDKITAIGDLSGAEAAKTIEASGHVVCPGFIDAHGHSDFTLFVNNRGESKIRQGITTEVTGNCGFTAGPFTEDHRDDLFSYLANTIILQGEQKENWRWKTQNEFLEHSAKEGLSFNIVPLVGQGMIHVGVMGFEDRDPNPAELERMKNMLKAELDAGFFGLSMAYAYEPAESVRESEIDALNDKGIVNGVSATRFAPEKKVTRAEFLTLVIKAMGSDAGLYNGEFADVKAEDWYAGILATAKAKGLTVELVENGNIMPNQPITREEIMTVLVKAAEVSGKSLKGDASESFSDLSDVSSNLKSYVDKAITMGWVKGSDGKLRPQGVSTRAEAAALINRYLGE